jgi:hypothetical protein
MTSEASAIERAFGLQAGEAYGADEECHTRNTKHRHRGMEYEVFYCENACKWEAWCKGIGSVSDFRGREFTVAAMRCRLASRSLARSI